jgi:hypothetical protein
MCHKVLAIRFDIILELVNNVEAARIPYDDEHKCFALDVESQFYDYIFSRKSPHAMS